MFVVELMALQERSDKLEDSMDMASKQSPEKLTELVSLQRVILHLKKIVSGEEEEVPSEDLSIGDEDDLSIGDDLSGEG